MIIVTFHVRPASQPCITSVTLCHKMVGRPRLNVLSRNLVPLPCQWKPHVTLTYLCFAITNTNTTLSVGIATRYGPGFESR